MKSQKPAPEPPSSKPKLSWRGQLAVLLLIGLANVGRFFRALGHGGARIETWAFERIERLTR